MKDRVGMPGERASLGTLFSRAKRKETGSAVSAGCATEGKRDILLLVGIALCALSLVYAILLQRWGYLTYLNSDMASEVILANRQIRTGSLIQMDWIYSTEIHSIHMNAFYALAFLLTGDYALVRIIGNMAGFLIGMGALYALERRLGMTRGGSLCLCALLPFAAGAIYASNMTIGGYYIIHLPFAFLGAELWLLAAERRRRGAFLLLCALEGLLSVRYMLCYVCPMLVAGMLEAMLERTADLRGRGGRMALASCAGFFACAAGYAVSCVVVPAFFYSGVGSASSFFFVPLDGERYVAQLAVIAADFLKLLGWRGEAALFSAGGIGNLCVAAEIFLGAIMAVRAYSNMDEAEEGGRTRRRMMRYALAAFLVNLFCFVFLEGAYLNRYLILAVVFCVPALSIALHEERNALLRGIFLVVFCGGLALSGLQMASGTKNGGSYAAALDEQRMDAADWLIENGYTHGYGSFWNVRVMQERTNGALTFTGITPEETESGAAVDAVPGFIRWLEPTQYSDVDICPGKSFLLLTGEEEETLSAWLAFAALPELHRNDGYVLYGLDSSADFTTWMLLGRATTDNAEQLEPGLYRLGAAGRLRIPPGWREAGSYVLRFSVLDGECAPDSVAEIYDTSLFQITARQPMTQGENELRFALGEDDQYFMIQLKSGGAENLTIGNIRLERAQ